MSDPAQQPAPGAPEGGAPEGGAPEGAAPGGGPPGAPTNLSSSRRLQQTQAQVQEVVDIMCVNVDKVLERDEMLSELDNRADALQAGASIFESSAAKLKRKYWWKNCKMMIMMGVIGAIVVVVIASPGWSLMGVNLWLCEQFPCSSPSKVTRAVSCLNVLSDMG
ncbi:vesicle-associated membrane protein 1 isoform X1 [Corvus kubaryi]|uniref:vesicle-associated membrane protein 1 isoform X3 n=1 Tax=Corvus moneduloides TaxID=1196302 RepID=UPI001362A9B1|nr:vesicle-associated membrane protein 1 isoform X3 [Corvus moneduloides]XP_041887155.1 vesicle-associated membrane protein 1 isoform X1 [Corvus kubaryi]